MAKKPPLTAQLRLARLRIFRNLVRLTTVQSLSGSQRNVAEKVFELAVLVDVLHRLAPNGRWLCTHTGALELSSKPVVLRKAPRFSCGGGNPGVAFNVNVRFGNGTSACEVHEADIAVFDPAQVVTEITTDDLVGLVECKYRASIAKSILRELAFFSRCIRDTRTHLKSSSFAIASAPWLRLSKHVDVLLAVAYPPKASATPPYWKDAVTVYFVDEMKVTFP